MPKERVQHGKLFVEHEEPGTKEHPGAIVRTPYYPGEPMPTGGVLIEMPSVDVTWNRDGGWVQLAFEAPRKWWEEFIASYKGSPEQHHFSAYSEVFDRRQINHMIRTLRRARDAAYGSDE